MIRGSLTPQDLPKIRTIRLNVVRNSKLRMVKDVEGLGPELQFPAFRKPKILLHRRIHIIRPGTTEIRLTHLPDNRLQRAIERVTHRLEAHTGIEFVGPTAGAAALNTLIVEVQRSGDLVPSVNEIEAYTLQVPPQQATVTASGVESRLAARKSSCQIGTPGDRN